jgi:hypothetical protein
MKGEIPPDVMIAKLEELCHKLKLFDIFPMEDSRKKPQIPIIHIYKALMFIPELRLKSFLQLDGYLRLPEAKELIGSKREMVASDSTITRVLKQVEPKKLREITNAQIRAKNIAGDMKIKITSGRKLSVGIVDGTTIGKKLASVLYRIGEVNLFVDMERIEKKGKELEASWKVTERNISELDLIVFDGLYYVKEKINSLIERGKHVLIKTKEKGLLVIQDAESMFSQYEMFKDTVSYYEGKEVRTNGDKFSYKIWSCGGFRTEGIDYPLKIGKVEMKNLKNNEEEVFYVITSLEELTGEEMKDFATWRWRIENNGFKKSNEHYAIKHAFIKNKEGWEVMTYILFIGFNLFELLRKELIKEKLVESVRRKSYKWLSEQLKRALVLEFAKKAQLNVDSS